VLDTGPVDHDHADLQDAVPTKGQTGGLDVDNCEALLADR
jgi:hypothetical protein